ncbi:MAG: PDZ domain-containing protein [Deltaproteobacteria bacterium]|nr:PDZ domain-containing protein [Deltaproteobacteria bacterium]
MRAHRRLSLPLGLLLSLLIPLGGDLRLARDAQAAVEPAKDEKKSTYDLASLENFRRAIVHIKDNYVDPARINPKEMFVASLEAVEKQVAEVMVEAGNPPCEDPKAKEPGTAAANPAACAGRAPAKIADGKVLVTVGGAQKEFDYSDIDSIWQIPLKMREVFTFVRDNLVTQQDQRDIEFAAVNGMLSTLDPHSWLLKPDQYKEMKVQTRGEFGGLGFVISMREDRLTVMKVLKNTPAARAGVKRGDVITQIDNDSTVSMDLQEAVDRMRGKPDTKVTIYVTHKGSEMKKLDLVRKLVTYETVTSKLLDNGIGYVRLASFSGTTTRDMQAAIRAMKAAAPGGQLKGLVMDLRGNPGGLLEQAIQVSDTFLEDGTIVTTVGMNNTVREEKLARNDGGEKDFPLAVLISSDSASASEIVAGALKNRNRALIIGRQSFGKGSVQLLYDNFKDKDTGEEAALKLTIAQYLTPGDMSIQEVGITPDIELVPARIIKDRIDLFAPPKTFREADYEKHFFNAFVRDEEAAKESRARAISKPAETLRFLREETAKEKKNREAIENGQQPDDDLDDELNDDDGVTVDYQIEFARDLLGRATSTDRLEQLQQMRPYVAEKRAAEAEKVKKALEAMGLDWSAAPADAQASAAGGKAKLSAEVKAARATAGDTMQLSVTAQNTGSTTLYRLRGYTKGDKNDVNTALDRREFVFGKLAPGEKRTWTVPVKIPKYTPSRRDDITVKWEDDSGSAFDDTHGETDIAELPRPAFAWSVQALQQGGQGDGMLRKGELTELTVDVKNTGAGQAYDAYVSLKNLAEDRLNVKKGRTKLGPIKPGETKTATFLIEMKKTDVGGDTPLPVRLEIGDRELWEGTKEKILLPVSPTAPVSAPSASAVKVTTDTLVLAIPDAGGGKLASVKKGTVLAAKGRYGEFTKVEWAKGRLGFLPTTASVDAGKSRPSAAFKGVAWQTQREPPFVKLTSLDLSKGGPAVDTDKFTLSGIAGDPSGMRDLQIFVQHENEYRKVFFKTATGRGELQSVQGPQQIDFTAELPLKPGNNTVFLIAREDDDLQAQRTVVIHRKVPALAAKSASR